MRGDRFRMARGSELPQSRLNETLVQRIRAEHRAKQEAIRKLHDEYSIEAQARRYGVHPNTIEKVLSYETWRHVRDAA